MHGRREFGVVVGVLLGLLAAAEPALSQRPRIDPREITPDFRSGAVQDRGELGLPEVEGEGDPSDTHGFALELLREACEVELALSAAPEELRDGAGLFVLRQDGYKRIRASNNGFDCLVARDHPLEIKPTCFDAEGTASILPKVLAIGDWLLADVGPAEIGRRLESGFASGQFRRARRPGVAYMLSNFNRPYSAATGTLGWFPPHVMFYAPDLTNEDIGFDPSTYTPGQKLPLIAYQGPHGYMVMVTGQNRPRSKGELRKCPDWVWE